MTSGRVVAPYVGLLCSRGDPFGEVRGDLLAGPALLAGTTPVRIYSDDIAPGGTTTGGEVLIGGVWTHGENIVPSALLDLSRPGDTRHPAEEDLLCRTPHSTRIDAHRYALLDRLSKDHEFTAHVLPCRPFAAMEDLHDALALWGSVILKSCIGNHDEGPYLIRRVGEEWLFAGRFMQRSLTDQQLELLTEPLLGAYFIQAFCPAVSADGRPYALLCTVQQRENRGWMRPTVHCVVGTGPWFASLSSGGEYIGAPFVPTAPIAVFPGDGTPPPGLNTRTMGLATAAAVRIAEWVGGHPGVLAMTILVDRDFVPRIVDIDTRPAAPCRAARNLDFYRYCIEFALGLAQVPPLEAPHRALKKTKGRPEFSCPLGGEASGASVSGGALSQAYSRRPTPTQGVSLRAQASDADAQALAEHPPAWLDLSVVQGGRGVLARLAQASVSHAAPRPFVSLRLGSTINDLGCAEQGIDRIFVLEDFLGRGILRWPEFVAMRSMRQPFLAAQFDLACRAAQDIPLDLVLIEDFDLGLRSLAEDMQLSAIEASFAWLGQLLVDRRCGAWGLGFSSSWQADGLISLESLLRAAAGNGLTHLGFRGKLPDDEVLTQLTGSGMAIIASCADAAGADTARRRCPGVHVLLPWSAVRHEP